MEAPILTGEISVLVMVCPLQSGLSGFVHGICGAPSIIVLFSTGVLTAAAPVTLRVISDAKVGQLPTEVDVTLRFPTFIFTCVLGEVHPPILL
jgi:hypothetical protein